MSECTTAPFSPDYAVIPGKTLAEALSKAGMTQQELADRSGLARKTINGIINGSEPITPGTAIQFEKVFRVPARFWMNLQNNYEEAKARLREEARLAEHRDWIKNEEIPLGELVKRGVVPKTTDVREQLRSALGFFGVASPDEFKVIWRNTQQAYSYRKADNQKVRFGCGAAWLRLGELKARDMQCAPFDKAKFQAAIVKIRQWVAKDIAECEGELVKRLAACGVALVFEPGIPGAPIYGATRWLTPDKAIVQMSLRGKDDGNFWFTLFHELGHILLHGKKEIFLEVEHGEATDKEEEANGFARNRLIPLKEYQTFVWQHGGVNGPKPLRLSKQAIRDFAHTVGVAPGVVVGRLQRDGWLPQSHCNDLKCRLGFRQE